MHDCLIIGAGITGLATAWSLHQQGHNKIRILEPSDEVGGSIKSFEADGFLCEEGPNSLQLPSPEVEAFLRTVPELDAEILEAKSEAKKRFIARGPKIHAVPDGPLAAITTPLWSVGGRFRVLKEPFIKPASPETEESVADFVRRRLGNELYQYAINPLVGGIYAGDPERLSLRYGFPKLYALEQNHGGLIRGAIAKMREARRKGGPRFKKRMLSFRGGMQTFPKRIATALGSSVICSAQIERISKVGDLWEVSYRSGDSGEVVEQSKTLLLTIPAHALAKLPFGDTALAETVAPLQKIHHPPVTVISLGFKRSQVTHPLDGFGALVPECEKRAILGALFPHSIFEDRAPDDSVLLTVFVGGSRQPELATPDEDQLMKTIRKDLTELLGVEGAPIFKHSRHWSHAIPQYEIGYGDVLNSIEAIEARFPGLHLAGNYRTGISLAYCLEAAMQFELA